MSAKVALGSGVADLAAIAHLFERFGSYECRSASPSPLYERLSLAVAKDRDLLELASAVPAGQPPANLLLASVHYLLLKGDDHPLRSHYPDIVGLKVDGGDPVPRFRSFCLDRREALRPLLSTRRVQTNEVGRSALLRPAFLRAWEQGGRPLFLVEIGSSAGLNLNWDRYRYAYSGHDLIGDPESPLTLPCEIRGKRTPPLFPERIPVAGRIGIDLNPIDLRDPDETLWLRSLVWPENHDRAERLRLAAELARRAPPPLLRGDALDLLPEAMDRAPADAALCVFHSNAVYQFSKEEQQRLDRLLEERGRARPLHRVSFEGGPTHADLRLTRHGDAAPSELHLAHGNPHGRWIDWLAD